MPGSSCVTTADPSVKHQALIWTLRKGEEKIISFTLLFQLWTTPIIKNLCNFFLGIHKGHYREDKQQFNLFNEESRYPFWVHCRLDRGTVAVLFKTMPATLNFASYFFILFSLVQNIIFMCSKIKCKVTKEAALWLLWFASIRHWGLPFFLPSYVCSSKK